MRKMKYVILETLLENASTWESDLYEAPLAEVTSLRHAELFMKTIMNSCECYGLRAVKKEETETNE